MKNRKNKKVLDIIKDNWYFILLVIPFVLFCIENRTPDNDIWALLTIGKHVVKHGITTIEPFTVHVGLNYVIQQWLSASIFYIIYIKLGKYGLLLITTIMFFILSFVYYKLCYLLTSNKKISFIATFVTMCLNSGYIVTRPQIFSHTMLILELICMEKYIKTDNWKCLIPLPLLSLFIINMHASVWILQFVFMLPVICNCINIKGITIDKIRFKPLFIMIIIMLLVGFINPYGYKAISFLLESYGSMEINRVVTELQPSNFYMLDWILCTLLLLSLFCLVALNKKLKLDIRYILYLCGTFVLGAMHGKCIIYFILYSGFVLAVVLNGYENFSLMKDLKKFYKNKVVRSLSKGIVIGLVICLTFTFFYTSDVLIKRYNMVTNDTNEVVDYILDNYDASDVILFIDFNGGAYSEYYGIKSYIDTRAEVFHDKFNKKENILLEYINVVDGKIDYDKFIDKYNFTHIIVESSSNFGKYMIDNDNYTNEYNTYFDGAHKNPYYQLYVKKDVA